ncbi:MAG: DUF2510 domain-containing protein [Actinomycetes bacterium]
MRTSSCRRFRRAVVGAVSIICVLSVTGCLDGTVHLSVNANRSGQLTVELFPSPDLLTAVGGSLDPLVNLLREAPDVQGSGVVISTVEGPTGPGLHVEIPFDDYRSLQVRPGGPTSSTATDLLGATVQRLTIAEAGGAWSFNATLDLQQLQSSVFAVPGGAPANSSESRITFSVSLPGRVAESNADSTDWGTATWSLSTADREVRTLTMVNDPIPPWIFAAGGIAAIGLCSGVVAVLRRRRRKRVHAVLQAKAYASVAPISQQRTDATTGAWGGPPNSAEMLRVPETPLPPAGWYPDPSDPGGAPGSLRWWDGARWTDHRS